MSEITAYIQHFLTIKALYFFILFFLISVVLVIFTFYLSDKTKLTCVSIRKIFHMAVFLLAWYIQTFYGFAILCIYGVAITFCVFIIVTFFRDRFLNTILPKSQYCELPLRSFKLPFISTMIGGIVSNLISIKLAPIGYLVVGFGDAFGALIGKKFGKLLYHVRLKWLGCNLKTIEGSLAVLIMSYLVIFLGLIMLGIGFPQAAIYALIAAICATIIEAISPFGSDNMFLQIFTVLVLKLLIN